VSARETIPGTRRVGASDFSITFAAEGTWAAVSEAERFLADRGFSVGAMQGPAPRAIMYGDYLISKWRNLRPADIAENHGVMVGNMRNGPVTITIYSRATEARAAIAATHAENVLASGLGESAVGA